MDNWRSLQYNITEPPSRGEGATVLDPAGKALQEWLKRALLDAEGKPKMSLNQLVEKSRVYKGSLYPILKGEGQGATDETLASLARILKVDPPRVERRVTFDQPEEPNTTLGRLRLTIHELQQLQRDLERLQGITPR
jgi:hypothetical protein